MRSRFLVAGLSVLGLCTLQSRSLAQVVIRTMDGVLIEERGMIEMPQMPAGVSVAAPEEAKPDPANSERAKKLKKLTFDRRSSKILEAWSTPAPEPPTEDDEEETGKAEGLDEVQAESTSSDAPTSQPVETIVEEAPGSAADAAEEDPGDVEDNPNDEDAAAEAAAKAAAEAEEAAAKAAAEAKQKAFEAKLLDHELKLFQRDVTLGAWDAVRDYLTGIDEAEAKIGYQQLLASLVKGPPKKPTPFAAYLEQNHYEPQDIVGLLAAAPFELEPKEAKLLGKLLKQCTTGGSLIEQCQASLEQALSQDDFPVTRLFVARVLTEAGFPIEAGAFLPTPDEAVASDERAALNLLARHYLALNAKEGKTETLEEAWKVTQAALAAGDIEDKDKAEALKRAVEIAPRIRDELGQTWLDESFTARPERGMEILATIGSGVSQGLVDQAQNADSRFKSLQLQSTATQALMAAAPELADDWRATLSVLATNWLKEAQHTYKYDSSTQRGPTMQRDPFGNTFYINRRSSVNRNVPKPISTDELLDIRPSESWLERVSDGLRPKLDMVVAQLLLKVSSEAEAFPFIEALAETHPDRARELVEEFLRVWAKNHDPNSDNRRRNSYVYFYGFEQRANAIPLTRSKQERNLAELSEWIRRLRELPIEGVDESLIANAFVAAHSTAEVYRVETIEDVFGPLDSLEPETLAELVQRMRTNLVGVWRDPATQKDKGTRRRQKDIQNEVQRGYDVALAVTERGLADHPDDWALQLARASVLHDRNNYEQEIAKSSEFAGQRETAFAEFARAADLYLDKSDELDPSDESTKVYETWFYASLGACDLAAIDHEKQSVEAQFEEIRQALSAFEGEAAERHMAMFANTLFTRMGSVNPAVKFRYVRSGLSIVGDHERARDAREVFEYYEDLVTEIKLETRVDGDDRVGHEEPFGLHVDLVHTREIERESGGFSKYLINQNNQAFSYNYGRPTEDYRDKFEEAAREALKEHFEVYSITFNHPDVNSRALERYGWRVTPYAYVLLRARGPEVDRVPSMRLDLDFLDTTGYAVLPIESPLLSIDSSEVSTAEDARPFQDVELVQTLDERQAKDGKLLLEVKATALGLVPGLDQLIDLAPDGFDVTGVDDQGVSVSKFDDEGEGVGVVSDRTWMVSLEAQEGLEELPATFAFGTPRVETTETVYQRYVDADLESVEAVVDLNERYGERSFGSAVPWAIGLSLLTVALVAGFVLMRGGRGPTGTDEGLRMPDRLSPFTVIGLLREIEVNNGVSPSERSELQANIAELERSYFRDEAEAGPELEELARTWLKRVS